MVNFRKNSRRVRLVEYQVAGKAGMPSDLIKSLMQNQQGMEQVSLARGDIRSNYRCEPGRNALT